MNRFLPSICLAVLCTSPAWAQERASSERASTDDGGIADIVVTAQRREEALQDVPIAVTALGRDQLESAQVRNTLDLKTVTPGLVINTSAGGYGSPRIRGVGTAVTGPGIENPVAVYVDGVYLASPNATLFSLTDVEQIAVLKGPQGTLFGRNATGGLIQITTRRPSETAAMEGDFTYGNLEHVRSDVYLTGGLAPGLAASFAGYYDYQGEGFGRNLGTGNDVQTHRNYAGRAKLYWDMDTTHITLSADYSKQRAVDPAVRGIAINLNGQPSAGGPRDITTDSDPNVVLQGSGASLTIRQELGNVELVSLTAYRKTKFLLQFDLDMLPVFFAAIDLNNRDKQLSQEFQLLSRGSGPFQWTIGGIYFRTVAAYDPWTILVPGAAIVTRSEQKMNSLAAFAQGTYALTEATNLTLGIRYTTDKRNIEGTFVLFPDTPLAAPQDDSKRFSKVTWRASVDHRFSPELLAYASYNRGFKSGAFVSLAFPTEVVKPEVIDSYEVGFKSDLLDRHVRLNVAGFYYDYQNPQAFQTISGAPVLLSAEGARGYGVDADAIFKATENLTFTVGASYLHGRYTSFPNAYSTTPILPGGGNLLARGFDAGGKRLQNTPDWTFNASAVYTVPTSFGELSFTGSYYHNDGYFTEPENRLREPAYDLLDASVTWTNLSESLDVKLWVKNLTDEIYSNQLTALEVGDVRTTGAGRTYGVTAGFRF